VLEDLKQMAADGQSLEEVGKFLTDKGLEFKTASGIRTAEQVPLDVLPRLAAVPDGKTELIESGKLYHVFRVVASEVAAIDEADARPHIEAFLSNQQGQRIAAQELKRLKSTARIEYLGDFSKAVTLGTGSTVAALKPEGSAQ
jgi:hypothetical protein